MQTIPTAQKLQLFMNQLQQKGSVTIEHQTWTLDHKKRLSPNTCINQLLEAIDTVDANQMKFWYESNAIRMKQKMHLKL